tara:strand:- start:387 stop:797 length:411 start_codon:yes stop_codon:yes gene_type:complete
MANQIKIRAEIMWAFLDKPNDMSGKYQVDLCNLSEAAIKGLEQMGVEVKHKEGKNNFITCKSQRPIFAFDDGGTQLDGKSVGNGSKAACLVNTYEWSFKGKKGVSTGVQKLIITDLVEFHGNQAEVVMNEDEDEIL